jgi:carbon-monoxide dehydrogenase large subunit
LGDPITFVGSSVPRVEDQRLLTGRGRFVDDVQLARTVHATFVRSPMPHARIVGIDTAAALAIEGVHAVYTGADMQRLSRPLTTAMAAMMRWPEFYALTTDRVRHVGDLVAMVVADDRYIAEDAAELIDVEYEALTPVATYEHALDPDRPALFEDIGTNVLMHEGPVAFGDVEGAFADADRVITASLSQHRVAMVPMETRGGVADYDLGTGDLTYHAAIQMPHGLRESLAAVLDHPLDRVRVLCADIGGSFGLKGFVMREYICIAVAAKELGRPVKWIEDRNEHLVASGHAREETIDAEVAVLDDGTVLGIKAKLLMDAGSYPTLPTPCAVYATLMKLYLPGPYRWRGYQFESTILATNKTNYIAYRGPWAMETWVRERLLDIVAAELEIDPADVRRRNMVDGAPDDRTPTGLGLVGVSSRESLERALEHVDYAGLRAAQRAARAEGRCVGIGMATFIEAAPGPLENRRRGAYANERAKITLQADGRVLVTTAQSPHGQGHETTLAQLAADELGVPMDQVRVVHGDTRQTPYSAIGTGGSRAATWASGAVVRSAKRMKEHVLLVAADMLEVAPIDLEIIDGQVVPKGVPDRAVPLADVAKRWQTSIGRLPPGVGPDLEVDEVFTGEEITGSGWSGGTHLCTVEIDLGTGQVTITRYLVVEDCGRVINPAIVEGQVHGGVVQGIGEVLYEHAAYDEDANFLAGTMVDYLLPTSAEVPDIEIVHLETPSEGGIDFRGVGEGGAIVAPATLTNAIEDALRPFGAKVRHQYLPPETILRLAGVVADGGRSS